MAQKKKVLMVCLGNSCRSPMAEAVFRDEVQKMGLSDFWEVESAAILGYHVGNGPEPRAMSTLRKAGITNYFHVARQITINDFYKFDWIFGMDEYNIYRLCAMQPKNSHATIEPLGKYDPTGEVIIKDPLFVCIVQSYSTRKTVVSSNKSFISNQLVVQSSFSIDRIPIVQDLKKRFNKL